MLNPHIQANKWFYYPTLLGLFLSLFLLGCGQQSDSQSVDSGAVAAEGNVSLTLPKVFQKPHLVGMTANVVVEGVGTFDLTVDLDGTGACGAIGVCGDIPGLTEGTHTYTIQYFLNGLELANAITTGRVTADATTPITFPALSFPDTDGDGFTNVIEVEKGSNPRLFGNPDLSTFAISSGTLNPTFDPKKTSYTASVGFLSRSVTVTPTVAVAGSAVAVNGVPSTSGAVDGSTRTYAINLTRQNAASFAQQAYVKASNTGALDQFGRGAALSGDTLAVGAHGEDSNATGVGGDETNNATTDSGAVYVFTKSGTEAWSQQTYIKAPNTDAGDQFGGSIALSGDTLAVGAHSEDSNATGVDGDETNNAAIGGGAVYVFTRNSAGIWSQQAYIKASNTDAGDFFGISVALSGDTLAVGAQNEDSNATGVGGDEINNAAIESGAVYVFTRNAADIWNQQAYIKASNTDAGDLFGESVALSGNTLAVGARFEDSKTL